MAATATAAESGGSSGRAREAHCLRLPGTLLTHVLGHIPQQQRLQHAAAVCSAFASAAAAATVSVDIDSLQSKDAPSFQAWIDRHAQQLVSVSVKTPDWNEHKTDPLPLSLPVDGLQQLRSLDLVGFEVLLPGRNQDGSSSVGDSGSGGTASTSTSSGESPDSLMPKLQALRLDICVLRTQAVLQLRQLSGLTFLQLRNLGQDYMLLQEQMVHGSWQQQLNVAAAVKRILQRSPQLVRLELACWNEGVMAQIGLLSTFAAHFPSSLTALRVGDLRGVFFGWRGPDLPWSVSTLTNLQELAACHVAVCPTALAGLAQLRDLQLRHSTFLPPQPTTSGVAVGASALLSSLSGMRKLQHLSVISQQSGLTDAQASEFAALTASSQLTYLQVAAVEGQPMPAAALQHMFPAGKQLPLLQHVSLSCDEAGAEAGHCTGADLRSMFSACPGLCSLDVTGLLHPDIDYDAWLDLPPTCCSLRVGGEELGDEFAGVMARLTHLTCLHWINSPDLTNAGLECLTDLRELQSFLMLGNHGLSDGVVVKSGGLHLDMFELQAGAQPIWQQLHDRLIDVPSNACWMRRLHYQAGDLQEALDQQQDERHFADHALHVIRSCAGNSGALQAALDLAELGCRVLAGTAAAADTDELQLKHTALQQTVLDYYSSSSSQLQDSDCCQDALDCMGGLVGNFLDAA